MRKEKKKGGGGGGGERKPCKDSANNDNIMLTSIAMCRNIKLIWCLAHYPTKKSQAYFPVKKTLKYLIHQIPAGGEKKKR